MIALPTLVIGIFFEEGYKVVVYDNHKTLSYLVVVSEIGTSNYLVYFDNCPNNVRRVSEVMLSIARLEVAVAHEPDVDRNHADTVMIDDDIYSVLSFMSDDFDDYLRSQANTYVTNNIYVENKVTKFRPGQHAVWKLCPAPVLPSLWSGSNLRNL